jgi:hypothetical protein
MDNLSDEPINVLNIPDYSAGLLVGLLDLCYVATWHLKHLPSSSSPSLHGDNPGLGS